MGGNIVKILIIFCISFLLFTTQITNLPFSTILTLPPIVLAITVNIDKFSEQYFNFITNLY